MNQPKTLGSEQSRTAEMHTDIVTVTPATKKTKTLTISCHNLYYTVQSRSGKCSFSYKTKEVLKDINAVFDTGMNAILGPTGGGKTSLLDVLAGRKSFRNIKGSVLINGREMPKNFNCMSGYVVQDDIIMGTLTVRENIMFSANLRLQRPVTREEIDAKVEETIAELGLTKCANTKIGNEFIRGVSGGERKRTNIGMELIVSPGVLFLDEPTTGLDASTSHAVMALLRKLSRKGRTIIFSIHQPRYSIFRQFDKMTLLADGRTVYHGPAKSALLYFSRLGYNCEQHNNPPDFFLDVINGDSSAVKMLSATGCHDEESDEEEKVEEMVVSQGQQSKDSLSVVLNEHYLKSDCCVQTQQELATIWDKYEARKKEGKASKAERGEYATSDLSQLKYVSKRSLLNLVRSPQSSIMLTISTLIFAVMCGLIFLRIGDNIDAGLQNRVGLLFFVSVNQMFANLPSIELFIKGRIIFLHESSSGFYRVGPYFLSKMFFEMLPLRLLPVTVYTVITYFMIGLQEDAGKFFIYYLDLFLVSMAASSLALAISTSIPVTSVATILVTLSYVISFLFAGLLVNLDKMGRWLSWLQYLSIARYSLRTLSINELTGLTLYTYLNNGTRVFPNNTVGSAYLTEQGITYSVPWDLWQNILALGIILIGFLIITYIQLSRMKLRK